MILPEAGSQAGYLAAERIRASITAEPMPPAGRITVSAGVCSLSEAGDAAELFRLADEALYSAKVP